MSLKYFHAVFMSYVLKKIVISKNIIKNFGKDFAYCTKADGQYVKILSLCDSTLIRTIVL